jgi:hypothetical protein
MPIFFLPLSGLGESIVHLESAIESGSANFGRHLPVEFIIKMERIDGGKLPIQGV